MSTDTHDDPAAPAPDEPSPDDGRYADLELEDGDVMIYDLENGAAWIQSDGAVELPAAA